LVKKGPRMGGQIRGTNTDLGSRKKTRQWGDMAVKGEIYKKD